jgi:hypothetical protein
MKVTSFSGTLAVEQPLGEENVVAALQPGDADLHALQVVRLLDRGTALAGDEAGRDVVLVVAGLAGDDDEVQPRLAALEDRDAGGRADVEIARGQRRVDVRRHRDLLQLDVEAVLLEDALLLRDVDRQVVDRKTDPEVDLVGGAGQRRARQKG